MFDRVPNTSLCQLCHLSEQLDITQIVSHNHDFWGHFNTLILKTLIRKILKLEKSKIVVHAKVFRFCTRKLDEITVFYAVNDYIMFSVHEHEKL